MDPAATVLVRKGRKINKETQPQHLFRLRRTNFRVLEGHTWLIQGSDQLVEASPLYLLSGREGLALFSHCSEYCWYLHWHSESNTLLFTGNAALGTAFEWRGRFFTLQQALSSNNHPAMPEEMTAGCKVLMRACQPGDSAASLLPGEKTSWKKPWDALQKIGVVFVTYLTRSFIY